MADPLTAAASEFAPRPSDLFDPRESGDIYNRWANAASQFSTGREVNQGIAEAEAAQFRRDDAARNKIIYDREDKDYADKQEYKSARGELLRDVAALDPLGEDYEQRIIGLVSASPELADDDAFTAIVNVGRERATESRRKLEQEAEDKRRRQLWEDEMSVDLFKYLGEQGVDDATISKLRDPETGRLNFGRASLVGGRAHIDRAARDAVSKGENEDRDATIRTFSKDSSLQDRVKVNDAAGLEALIKQREAALKAVNAAFTEEDLKLSEDAFAAKLAKDLIPDSLSLENEEKARARATEVKALAKDYHRAHRARSLVAPATSATSAPALNPAAHRFLPTLPNK